MFGKFSSIRQNRNFGLKLTVLLAAGLVVLFFQNCSGVQFQHIESSSASEGAKGGPSLASVSASTKKNQPVTFSAGTLNGSYTLSFDSIAKTTDLKTTNGVFKILDPVGFQIKYTPNLEFVGTDQITVYAIAADGAFISGQVQVFVGNILNLIEPALAVRGIACITCHSNVSSSVVTDYGLGNSWYFDTVNADSFYADRLGADNGLATLNLTPDAKFYVPVGPAPASIRSTYPGVTSLADFARERFTEGGVVKTSQVDEVSSLKISIPSEARIREVFANPTSRQVYYQDTQKSPALQGLVYDSVNNVFNVRNLICDGDLFLDAPVIFNNATIQSINGCRIYSVGTVFVEGNLTSAAYGNAVSHNIQLLSSRSIWAGTGKMYANGQFCEVDSSGKPSSWYYGIGPGIDCSIVTNADDPRCDSLNFRAYCINGRNTFSSAYPDANSLNQYFDMKPYQSGDGILAQERKRVESSLGGPLLDASCGADQRAVAFSRVLLAAPYVNDRYNGGFSGAIVAEVALMSLGTFQFQFDPVFKTVSIFSLLKSNELISGDLK